MTERPALGRYQILKELGRGAMGRVFLAEDPEIQRRVAIKTIQVFSALPEADRAEARERFTREARSAGKLLHPGIVTIFDVGDHKGIPYLAMELVEGESLDRFCRPDHLLPVAIVLDVIRQAAEALSYAHREGVVHRDIKPANLMLVDGSRIKIMDFGLARAPASRMTSAGVLMGTPGYMSPEQIRGGSVDGRSDLFALACVLFELLTGRKPFDGDSISTVVYQVVHEDPPDLSPYRARVSPEMEAFLRKAMAKEAGDRFPDGEAFLEALSRAGTPPENGADRSQAPEGSGDDAQATPDEVAGDIPLPPPVHARRKPKSSFSFGLVLILLLIGLALAGYVFRMELLDLYRGKPFSEWFGGGEEPGTPPPLVVPQVEPGRTATVRTEPAGLPVLLNGTAMEGNIVEFPDEGSPGTLSASLGCRKAEYLLSEGDIGQEVVLVLDPLDLHLEVPAPVEGARLSLNGGKAVPAPSELELDLCRENVVEFRAAHFQPVRRTIPAGATPLQARTGLSGVSLEPIPTGVIRLPESSYPLLVDVDGKRAGKGLESVELEEGRHKIRLTNERYWVDVSARVEVKGGETGRVAVNLPKLAELSVLAYPPNCKVYLARPEGGDWHYVGDTPLPGYSIAAGSYRLRVELVHTGAVQDQDLKLKAGPNPPVRVTFGGRR